MWCLNVSFVLVTAKFNQTQYNQSWGDKVIGPSSSTTHPPTHEFEDKENETKKIMTRKVMTKKIIMKRIIMMNIMIKRRCAPCLLKIGSAGRQYVWTSKEVREEEGGEACF